MVGEHLPVSASLSLEQLNAKLQQLYFDVWSNFSDEGDAIEQIQLLNHLLFSRLRFSANTKNFHAPSNNMLHQVLESRKGNPISLSMVYLLVANRLGLPVYGVNLPNLFVLTYKFDGQQFYINPFNKGILFSRKDVEHYLEHLRLPTKESYFEPCDSMAIIRRFFRNLGLSFEKLGNPERVEEIRELLRLLQDDPS
ncbi:transglutaminase-like domain-containing protein [Nitritalea halalkaliphila]|uniref:transglutaminase-like domain-containing protein n=1 Tax=Nitritalea halalkaliphila TaxID=590849 RepID=UPI00293437E5|nr:transglutaminase-like domain-containing protein [Nitritalea halalkaliphila]